VKKNRVQPSEASEQQHSNHNKVAKMLLMVVGLFFLTWMPHLATNTLYSLTQDPSDQFVILHDYCQMLLGVNSFLNPLIYANQNKLFRAAFARLLRKAKVST
jgi:arginine exporter protein ArgO